MATHDTLTGLYNKDYFSVKVAEVLKEKTDEDWLLVCSNIKDFKLINDLFGIEKGNEVLKMQADILRNNVVKVLSMAELVGISLQCVFLNLNFWSRIL